tara:strand:+ start:53 stop:1297 length:1245 start_codon:yes stop_codon:yes gene_type:complete
MNLGKLLSENMLRFGVKNLNESAIKNLLEQEEKLSKDANPDYLLDTYNSNSRKVGNPGFGTEITGNPNHDNQLAELKSNPIYDKLMKRFSKPEQRAFLQRLSQASRLVFLQQTKTWAEGFLKAKQLARKKQKDPNFDAVAAMKSNWKAKLVKGKIEKDVTSTAVKQPAIAIDLPLDIKGSTTYVDNSTQPGQVLIAGIDTWVKLVAAQFNEAKQQNPNAVIECSSIDIASSCSRLRNTNGMTWNELSKGRAEVVYKILIEKLKGLGVAFNPNMIKQLRGGFNGDGSSGPDAAKNFKFDSGKSTTNMSYSIDGNEPLRGSDDKRFVGTYGSLMTDQSQSHQYKFCTALVKVTIKAEASEDTVLPKVVKVSAYSLLLQTSVPMGQPRRLKPFKNIKWKISFEKVKNKLDACKPFGN